MDDVKIDRRGFLKNMGLGLATGVLATAPWLDVFANEKHTVGERCRVGLIGPGSRGRYLLDILVKNPKVEVVALCDNYQPCIEKALVLAPKAKVYSDYRELLACKEIDCIVIATPPTCHARMTLDAFDAGKNVFVEKAMSVHADEVLQMYEAYKKSGKILFVGQQRFFDPRYIKTMTMLHSGDYGAIQSIRMVWDRNTDWRRPVPSPDLEQKINWRLYKAYSKGLMTELACHQLQIGMWAMKSIPNSVMGMGSRVARAHEREVYDNVSCIYGFDNGVKMTYESTNSNKFYGVEEQILCEKATFEPERGKYYHETILPASGLMRLLNETEHKIVGAIPLADSSWVPETANPNNGEFILGDRPEGDGSTQLVNAFIEAVITGQQPKNFAEESYYGTQLCLLGHEAMERGEILTFPDKYKLNYLNHTKL